ncbi:MAG: hypothetical protein ACHBNF_04035 [Chromatiales bacterium]
MKANVEKRIGLAVLGVFVGLYGLPVYAGYVSKPGVYMYDKIVNGAGVYYAEGSMVGARDSADSQQYIGCYSFRLATGGPAVKCVAQDFTGRYLFCTGYDSKWAEPVKAMTSSSFVQFASASTNGNCLRLHVENNSRYLR